MAGHSQFKNIMHRKARQDKKKAKVFTKIIRDLMSTARQGGGDIKANPSLRATVDEAREANMPKDTIDRAIKRGTGEIAGADYVEMVYEGYGPGQVALMVKALSDNKVRTAANVRSHFTKNGGTMGESGTVGWMFDNRGVITYPRTIGSEDKVMEAAINAGAQDVITDDDTFQIVTEIADFAAVGKSLAATFGKPAEAELTYLPKQMHPVTDAETAQKLMALVSALEDDDDVQSVITNADMDDATAAKVA
jgi:YebC/PmpR family DNA-binding regulatory protein